VTGSTDRRPDPEQQRGQAGYGTGEQQDSAIDFNWTHPGHRFGNYHRQNTVDTYNCAKKPYNRTGSGNNGCFREQQPDDPESCAAQRTSNGYLTSSRVGPDEHEVRDVSAGYE